MPYNRIAIKCPCNSGKSIEACHGAQEASANFDGRVRYLHQQITRYQPEQMILQNFSGQLYKSVRNDFDVFLDGVRQINLISITSGQNWHQGMTLEDDNDDLGVEPDYIPPDDMILLVVRKADTGGPRGDVSISPGIYRTAITAIGRVSGGQGQLGALIRYSTLKSGLLTENGKSVKEAEVGSNVFWQMVEKQYVAIRSASLLNYEVFKHTAA